MAQSIWCAFGVNITPLISEDQFKDGFEKILITIQHIFQLLFGTLGQCVTEFQLLGIVPQHSKLFRKSKDWVLISVHRFLQEWC
ncbi:DNA/RNA non-specific endonuclease [Sesbania bispinosa]|nr:DNA/RNA non-specific endonuclease [Sesbania bispinosa]